MTATEMFVAALAQLKAGDLGVLRNLAGQSLDETVPGFDLFTGLWWPLRQKSQAVPRRTVAWLVAKLYAYRQVRHKEQGPTLARQLRRCQPNKDPTKRRRFERRVDELLAAPICHIEPHLQWALGEVQHLGAGVDWVKLTDDLSGWHQSHVRQRWVDDYLNTSKETDHAD